MRIAVFIKNTHFHKSFGGMETQNKVLVECLTTLGHDICVYSPAKEITESTIIENSIKYIFVPCIFRKFSVLHSWSPNDWAHKSYEYFLKDHKQDFYDIVVCQSSSGLGLLKHKKTLDVKIISISHGSKMGEFLSRLKSLSSMREIIRLAIDIPHVLYAFFFTQRDFVHGSDKIIAVSAAVKKALIDETFVSEAKVIVINNGIKAAITEEDLLTRKPNEIPELLYVGRIIRAKGLFLLVEVLNSLKNLPWHLSIVGDGDDLKELVQKTKDLKLSDRVTMLGKISHSAAMSKMLDADIFLLPSVRIEGLPMVIIEAMFAGLPVIATDVGGNSDAVRDGQTGYLVKPGDKDDLQRKLSILLGNNAERARMGKNARLLAERDFTESIMANKYLKVIQELLNENS